MAKDLNLWPNKSREVTSVREQRNIFSEHDWREGNKFKHRIIVNSATYTGEASSAYQAKKIAEKKAEDARVDLEFYRNPKKVSTGKVGQLN